MPPLQCTAHFTVHCYINTINCTVHYPVYCNIQGVLLKLPFSIFLSTRSHVNLPNISLSARGYTGILYIEFFLGGGDFSGTPCTLYCTQTSKWLVELAYFLRKAILPASCTFYWTLYIKLHCTFIHCTSHCTWFPVLRAIDSWPYIIHYGI